MLYKIFLWGKTPIIFKLHEEKPVLWKTPGTVGFSIVRRVLLVLGFVWFFLHLSLVRWSRNVPLIRVYCCEKYVGCIGFVFCFEAHITGFQTNCAQLQPGFIVLRIILALELKRIHLQLDAQIETHNHISHNAIFLI